MSMNYLIAFQCIYLMATMALSDNVHLNSITLEEQDTAWLNLKYKELLLGTPEHLHLLAIYPKKQ